MITVKNNEDKVNHPFHYEGSTSIECIQAMHLIFGDVGVCHFCLLNSFKYLWRYKNKNGAEDLEKATWYLDHVKQTLDARDIGDKEISGMYERMTTLLNEVKSKYDEKK